MLLDVFEVLKKTQIIQDFFSEPNRTMVIFQVFVEQVDNMGDIKLVFIDNFLTLFLFLENNLFFFFSAITVFLQNGFFLYSLKFSSLFPQNVLFIFSLKFFLCILFLILIRGGTPRYRYDYLTKLGWLKFLSLIILIFSSSLLFFFIF